MTKFFALLAALAAALLIAVPALAGGGDDLANARAGTAQYHQLSKALDNGFGILHDAAGIACIDKPGVGGMGIHYVLGSRIADINETAGAPEVLVYEPQPNGRMQLVAVEYVVFQAAWD